MKPHGYWNSIDNVINELKPIIQEVGQFPTAKQLLSIEKSSLSQAIRKHGGSYVVAKMMGVECSERPKGYWNEERNVITEAINLIDKYGDLPSQNQLSKMGLSSLTHAARRFYGGLLGLKKHLNITHNMKPPSYWTKDNIIKHYYGVYEKLGRSPSYNEIIEIESSGFSTAIQYQFGGLNKLKSYLGESVNQIKEKGYWEKKENIQKEVEGIIKKLGHLPTMAELSENGLKSICHIICGKYGGVHNFYTEFGFTYEGKKPRGYWKNKDNFGNEAMALIKQYGVIPSSNELTERGHTSFLNAAQLYHGGINDVRQKFCDVFYNQKKEYWEDWDNVEKLLIKLIGEIGRFPSWNEINLHSKLPVSALKLHGGIEGIRGRMGYTDKTKKSMDGHENDSFQECLVDDFLYKNSISHKRNIKLSLSEKNCTPDFMLSEFVIIEVLMVDYRKEGKNKREKDYILKYQNKKKVYLEHGYTVLEIFPDDFASTKAFKEATFNMLNGIGDNEIIIDPKTIPNLDSKRTLNYWNDFENLKNEILPICEELDRFPSRKELAERGAQDLSRPIGIHGGTEKVAKRLGYTSYSYNRPLNGRKPSGYWKNDANYKNELDNVIAELQRFPTQKEMGNALAIATARRGGIAKVKHYFNY